MYVSTFPMYYIRSLLRSATASGLSAAALLRYARIDPDVLDDDRARASRDCINRLFQAIASRVGSESLGFETYQPPLGSFAMMCNASIQTSTLGLALQKMQMFYAMFPLATQIEFTRTEEVSYFELKKSGGLVDPEHLYIELGLAIFHRYSQWLIDQPIPLDRVELSFPKPPFAHEYAAIFSAPAVFSAEHTRLVIPPEIMDAPIVQDRKSLKIFLRGAPLTFLTEPEFDRSLTAKVRRLMQGMIDRGEEIVEMDGLAAEFHFTPATLRRKLQQEQTSYRKIKDDVRRDIAVTLLEDDRMSLENIAFQLGFEDSSSFFRAFKRWTGTQPRSFMAE